MKLFCQVLLQLRLEAGNMADLRRQKDSPIEIAHVVPIDLPPAADAQAQASVRGDGSFPHIVQKMWARISVSTKSLIHSITDQSSQRNLLGAPESFLWQQKRFRAEKVAVCRNERLNPQTLKGQALCCVGEKEFQCPEKNGISGESSAQSSCTIDPLLFAEIRRVTIAFLSSGC